LGIGTASPGAKLDIQVNTSAERVAIGYPNSDPGIMISDSSGNLDRVLIRALPVNTVYIGDIDNNSGSLILRTGGSDRMFLSSTGNVGIGTTTPQQELNVIGDANITGTYNSLSIIQSGDWIYLSGDGSIESGLDISIPKYTGRHFYYGYGGRESHYFGQHGNELIIDSDGNLIAEGDITLGQKITFAFGEIIDNIIDGWIKITGNLNVTGNVTAENVHLPTYLSAHTNNTIPVASAGVWINVTFDNEESLKQRINHTYNDATNDTFTINDDGIYEITYTMSFQDSAVVPNSHVVTRIIKNGVEVNGFTLEEDLGIQDQDKSVHHSDLVSLSSGDIIKLQFTSDDTTVSLDTHLTYGTHKNTGHLTIKRI